MEHGLPCSVNVKHPSSFVKSAVKFVNSLLFGLNIYRFPETCEVTAAVMHYHPEVQSQVKRAQKEALYAFFDLPGVDLPV